MSCLNAMRAAINETMRQPSCASNGQSRILDATTGIRYGRLETTTVLPVNTGGDHVCMQGNESIRTAIVPVSNIGTSVTAASVSWNIVRPRHGAALDTSQCLGLLRLKKNSSSRGPYSSVSSIGKVTVP